MTVIKRNKKDVWQIQVITGYKYINNIKKSIKYSEMFYGKKSDARIRENEIKAKIKKGCFISNEKNTFNDVNVNTKMYKKGNLFMYKKRNEIVHLI